MPATMSKDRFLAEFPDSYCRPHTAQILFSPLLHSLPIHDGPYLVRSIPWDTQHVPSSSSSVQSTEHTLVSSVLTV